MEQIILNPLVSYAFLECQYVKFNWMHQSVFTGYAFYILCGPSELLYQIISIVLLNCESYCAYRAMQEMYLKLIHNCLLKWL